MDPLGTAQFEQRAVIRKQPHRLMSAAGQQFVEIFDQCLVSVFYHADRSGSQRDLAGLDAFEQIFGSLGDDGDAVDIDNLQRAVGLMQIAFCVAQRRRLRIGVLRQRVVQRGF